MVGAFSSFNAPVSAGEKVFASSNFTSSVDFEMFTEEFKRDLKTVFRVFLSFMVLALFHLFGAMFLNSKFSGKFGVDNFYVLAAFLFLPSFFLWFGLQSLKYGKIFVFVVSANRHYIGGVEKRSKRLFIRKSSHPILFKIGVGCLFSVSGLFYWLIFVNLSGF
jgi:hypothetical protein